MISKNYDIGLFVFVVEGEGQIDIYAENYGDAFKKLTQKFCGNLDYRKYYLDFETLPNLFAPYYRYGI